MAATTTQPRRQPSTTSLSKYIRAEPSLEQRSLDFCNAFWGPADGGVDVLLARIRGAARTVDEVKTFYKERVAIEEDYAKRLNKLAKMNVGRDEIGELRNAIDTLRLETDKQASSHLVLAQTLKTECEVPVTEFATKEAAHRKNYTTAVERFFKNKQTQEGYVTKSREKYEQDCNRINFCTAKLSIEQGKELEKTQLKLDRARASIQSSEKEYQNFVRALKDTWSRWEKEWKGYCDRCQDLEEERIEFLKDNFWMYANSVSTVCVSDDESCETLRVALEQLETEKDMENFVRDYGTGALIPEPPPFIDYSAADPRPPPTRPRNANFARSSMRTVGGMMLPADRNLPEEDEISGPGNAGIGAVGMRGRDTSATPPTRTQSRASSRGRVVSTNTVVPNKRASWIPNPSPTSVAKPVTSPSPSAPAIASKSMGPPLASEFKPAKDPHAAPVDPTSETMIKIGDRAYPADPNKDPQSSLTKRPTSRVPPPSAVATAIGGSQLPIGGQDDPLLRQMNELQKEGSVRRGDRNSVNVNGRPGIAPQQGPPSSSIANSTVGDRNSFNANGRTSIATQQGPPSASTTNATVSSMQTSSTTSSALSPPGGSRTSFDYHSAAESLVGAHPSSRPASPAATAASPPMAKHMQPPPASSSSPHLPVEDVLNNYQQRLPGERPLSTGSRRRDSYIDVPPAQMNRPVSPAREGHVGIGAHGRASPQPIQARPLSRGPSPQPSINGAGPSYPSQQGISPNGGPAHSPGPGSVGIRLDPTGRVVQDSRADAYGGPQPQAPPPQQQSYPDPRASTYGRPVSQPPQQPQQRPQQPPLNQYAYQSNPPSVNRAPSVRRSPSPQPSYGGQPPINRSWQAPQQYPPGAVHPQQPSRINTDVGPSVARQQSTLYNPHSATRSYGGHPQQQAAPPVQPQRQPSYGGYVQNHAPPQPQAAYGHNGYVAPPNPNGIQRNYGGYSQPPPVQHDYRGPSVPPQQMHRSPSPQPPAPQPVQSPYQEEPKILFYVKALYDYRASIDEEFDFQANDIIAVTSTPDDGWWTGLLLDESRRAQGRNVFPSNFVTFF